MCGSLNILLYGCVVCEQCLQKCSRGILCVCDVCAKSRIVEECDEECQDVT